MSKPPRETSPKEKNRKTKKISKKISINAKSVDSKPVDPRSALIDEKERLELARKLNRTRDDTKEIKLSKNIRNIDANSLRIMQYTNTIIIPPHLKSLESELSKERVSCSCKGDTCELEKCDHEPVYNYHGRLNDETLNFLRKEYNFIIHECNKGCECNSSCPNRVTQKGSTVQKEIFSTESMGLGVRTLEYVAKGTFIGRYTGRLLTFDESKNSSSHYMFEMDAASNASMDGNFSIDAARDGNITRLINHNCEPNLQTVSVRTEITHPKFHEVAFFTKRDINRGEELFITYGQDYFKASGLKCQCPSC